MTEVKQGDSSGGQGCHGTGKTGNLKVHFSRQGKHREFAKKYFKKFFTQGILPPTQGKFECLKKKRTCNLSGWNYPLAVLCQDLGLCVILAAVLS